MLKLFCFFKPGKKYERRADGLVDGVGALDDQLEGQRVDSEGKDAHERATRNKNCH